MGLYVKRKRKLNETQGALLELFPAGSARQWIAEEFEFLNNDHEFRFPERTDINSWLNYLGDMVVDCEIPYANSTEVADEIWAVLDSRQEGGE